MPGAARASYSFQGQDTLVVDVLQGQRGGYFLDTGAGDGVDGSNTLLLERDFGWQGTCVEPNDEFFRKLRENRRCSCLNYCLYDKDDMVEFMQGAAELGGIVEAYTPTYRAMADDAVRYLGPRAGQPIVVRKQARTARSLLREVAAPPVIDYWSLDTEGSELRILRGFPFDAYRVRVLTVEHNHTAAREEIRLLLDHRGFDRLRSLDIDDAYVSRDVPRPRRSHAFHGRSSARRPRS